LAGLLRTFVAVNGVGSEAAGSRIDRDREIVQRTAELLTSTLSLEELFHAVCSLLARFVDASTVFVALRDNDGARIAFMLENGVAGPLENRRVRPGSCTDRVLRTGKPMLKRDLEDWIEGRTPLNLPGEPQTDGRVSAVFVPLKFGSRTFGVLSVQSMCADAYDESDVELLQTCALYLSVRVHQAQLETQSAQLENIASTDSVTGVPNRRSFNDRLANEWRRANRRGAGVALMFMDIDFFKPFNDTYGHVAGDAALQQVAQTLSACLLRPQDFFARYGGEEFVAILPETDLSGALQIAERMRAGVYELGIAHSGSQLQRLTISIGVAWKRPRAGLTPETLIREADAALYEAKHAGRNRIAAEKYRSDTPPAHAAAPVRHNLPLLLGQTFGGVEHVQQIRKLMRTTRLLTIIGPAGIGKSRQAIRAAELDAARYSDGVFYIDCATITDERYFPSRIAMVLGLASSSVVSPERALANFMKSKKALIVLDNADAVARAWTAAMRVLIAQSAAVRVLVTAREPLHAPAEVAFVLPPLELDDAAELFVDRARSIGGREIAEQERALVEQVCVELGGLPRALHLAAAQLRDWPLDELMQRLPDPVALGYDVLSQQERELLHGLSVFTGGATIEALEYVCGKCEALPSLLEKGLVSVEAGAPERYVVPGSIQAFAAERARDAGIYDRLALRHAQYFFERAKALDSSFATREWQPIVAAMHPELENLRAALLFTITQENDVSLGAEMSALLIQYWHRIGRGMIAREWIEELLDRDVAYPIRLRARLLYGIVRLDNSKSKRALEAALAATALYRELGDDDAGLAAAIYEVGVCYSERGELDSGETWLRESLEISERIGNMRRIADALNGIALVECRRGRVDLGRELFERSLKIFRTLEDDRASSAVLGNLGDLAASIGEYDTAVRLTRQSLAILERLNDPQATAGQLLNIGTFELKRGNTDAARPALQRALELVRECQDEWLGAYCIDALSRLAAFDRDWIRALRLAGFADAVFDSIGVPRQPMEQSDYEQAIARAKEAVGEEIAVAVMRGSAVMEWSEAVSEAMRV
jgi:diguanylate cyclase (GGDEF)-like protein